MGTLANSGDPVEMQLLFALDLNNLLGWKYIIIHKLLPVTP